MHFFSILKIALFLICIILVYNVSFWLYDKFGFLPFLCFIMSCLFFMVCFGSQSIVFVFHNKFGLFWFIIPCSVLHYKYKIQI